MNKHRKTISREIKNIMAGDKLCRITYKEAKRLWKEGVRPIPINTLRALAQERGCEFYYTFLPGFERHELRFVKKLSSGTKFKYCLAISCADMNYYRGNHMDVVDAIMQELDLGMRGFGIETPGNKEYAKTPISFTGMSQLDFGR